MCARVCSCKNTRIWLNFGVHLWVFAHMYLCAYVIVSKSARIQVCCRGRQHTNLTIPNILVSKIRGRACVCAQVHEWCVHMYTNLCAHIHKYKYSAHEKLKSFHPQISTNFTNISHANQTHMNLFRAELIVCVFQCDVVCCSMLQCVTLCCSVLRCAAV